MFFYYFDEDQAVRKAAEKPILKIVDGSVGVSVPDKYTKYLRIHGDNIVECERTLKLIKEAYHGQLFLLRSPLYRPKYQLIHDSGCFVIELFSGHGRWGIDIVSDLQNNGGILREGADSYVTELRNDKELLIFALEYCSALPAGNNAWQRNGRALSSVLAGIPYLYFAEIGGVELDSGRNIKAPRFPNPVVPFSYLSTSNKYNSLCVPVYITHPSITDKLYNKFKEVIGVDESLEIIKGLIDSINLSNAIQSLIDKDLKLVKLLSNDRKTIDTLRGEQWDGLLSSPKPEEWLSTHSNSLVWKKKTSDKVCVSPSFKTLLATVLSFNCLTVGGTNLPICIIPVDKLVDFESLLKKLYPSINASINKDKPLAIVWITGFKPKGDDSRPDRGLVPLARMILGPSVELMSIVYGPAKPSTWVQMKTSLSKLCGENGLWQAIFSLSNHILVDSITLSEPYYLYKDCQLKKNSSDFKFDKATDTSVFSEDDIDCAIHQIFAHKNELGILEGLCNPPGGDWSGISCYHKNVEYRWTSLPRVSPIGGKRPDHVIQIAMTDKNIFFSIESKGKGATLEKNIGKHLSDYMRDLFLNLPTAYRNINGEWRSMEQDTPTLVPYSLYSVGAFLFNNENELSVQLERGKLNAVMAFEMGIETILHVKDATPGCLFTKVLQKAQNIMTGFIIKIH